MERYQEIEHSLHKKFSKTIWSKFISSIQEYELLSPGDCVAVCVSGGKDSMLLAKLFQQLQKISNFPFELKFLSMDPGYRPENRQLIEENAALMQIPLHIFDARILDVVNQTDHSPCYLCARMRRGNLYANAKALGCNKIALGHHFDDVIETVLMSMLYGSQIRTMMPKVHSDNFGGMELIRPLYLVREREIIRWANYNRLTFLRCACDFTAKAAEEEGYSKRDEIKKMIAALEKGNPQVPHNIFQSIHHVNLQTVVGYVQDGETHSFLEHYDDWAPESPQK